MNYFKMMKMWPDCRRLEMRENTWAELLECYKEAVKEYEAVVEDQMFDDEEHDRIEELRHELEEVANEIFRRKMESRSENRLENAS